MGIEKDASGSAFVALGKFRLLIPVPAFADTSEVLAPASMFVKFIYDFATRVVKVELSLRVSSNP